MVLAGDVREDVGNGLDQEIAARVAEGVVHLLEAVDIDEEDGVHGSWMQATCDEVRQGAAVADARELVDRADRVQLLMLSRLRIMMEVTRRMVCSGLAMAVKRSLAGLMMAM